MTGQNSKPLDKTNKSDIKKPCFAMENKRRNKTVSLSIGGMHKLALICTITSMGLFFSLYLKVKKKKKEESLSCYRETAKLLCCIGKSYGFTSTVDWRLLP